MLVHQVRYSNIVWQTELPRKMSLTSHINLRTKGVFTSRGPAGVSVAGSCKPT